MATITLRSIKGAPLTIAEVDTNFSNLNVEIGQKLDISSYTAADILTKLKTVDTDDSGLNASTLKSLDISSSNTTNTVVVRDVSGNFSANNIIANNFVGNLTGNASGTSLNVTGIVSVANGGTGSASASGALDNLLPSGEVAGYVLKTSGPGSYYWSLESGATTLVGTRINTSRTTYTATAGQTLFTGTGTYTIGAGQLRVYINGVRQFPDAYTETSTSSFTLTDPVAAGTKVMAEVDANASYDILAAAVSFAPTGTLSSTNVQNAIVELLNELSPFVVPSGGIIIWSGSSASIPSGWALCNGTNGTPDLRDRFVVGAGSSYSVGNTGGTKDAVVVSHSHSATSTVSDPGHNHTASVWRVNGANDTTNRFGTYTDAQARGTATTDSAVTGITVSTSISSAGSSGTNMNLPPYYALCYIMKL